MSRPTVAAASADAAPEEPKVWRRRQRERLLTARLEIPSDVRAVRARHMAEHVAELLRAAPDGIVAGFWPIKGEPDLRPWMRAAMAEGIRFALPVVLGPGRPLEFRRWHLHSRMDRGRWNIPVPSSEEPVVIPSTVILPLVGFDRAGYRIGYGGGFYDRTLAALDPRPLTIGVGYREAGLPTIHPEPHDVPVDHVVTG